MPRLTFDRTDPTYFLQHQSTTTGPGRKAMETLATRMVQLALNMGTLRVRYDARVKPDDGGRFCVYDYVEEQFTDAQRATGRVPFKGFRRIYIIEDPNGGFTIPDTWVVAHLKNMRALMDDLKTNATGEVDPTAILNPHAT